ncbi:hypothetical protein JET68_08020 [Pseudomonas monteilii]|uniref:hypothetical protein n=1 Tax=Pseudomonas TaxID=286 RepID=UPI0018E6A6AD|nr:MULTISPECIES: hypothetical protein [Pseudomonas]MBI6918742.1 hypothetical protein [Pseudomonas monteilii]MCE0937310.1 hypothetical protein [Pseudomonas kurunegalensis]
MNVLFQQLNEKVERVAVAIHELERILANIDGLQESFSIDIQKLNERIRIWTQNGRTAAYSTTEMLAAAYSIGSETRELTHRLNSTFGSEVIHSAATRLDLIGNELLRRVSDVEVAAMREELASLKNDLFEARSQLRDTTQQHKEQLQLLKSQASDLNIQLDDTRADMAEKIGEMERSVEKETLKIIDAYKAADIYLTEKKYEIDKLVGDTAAKVIAGDYHNSAAQEKKTADRFRWGAIACMAAIVWILGDAALATMSPEFDWQRTLTRVTLVFLLSVPAAYLARESAKHREQQYHFHQTSLDTRAISPFISSLPDDEQHKIKSAVAAKLFAGRDFSKVGNDPFPINSQEILMELIKKLEMPSKPKPE